MSSTLGWCLVLVLLGQDFPDEDKFPESSADRLKMMKESLAGYTVRSRGEDAEVDRLVPDPALRFTNPVGGSKDGCVFLWVGEWGRPSAAAQVYWNPSVRFVHELTSLSTAPLSASSSVVGDWRPSRAGIEFKPIPDAPKPAETPERRLRQMNALAEGFSSRHFYKQKTWNELRLMAKPFLRYGKAGSPVEDGALFCFAHGTDPELFLMIEARPGTASLEWQFAFAPMTTFGVNASWKDKEIWSKAPQANGSARDPSNTFLVRRYLTSPE